MNVCFLSGKVISKIKFDFLYNKENISIASFFIEVCDKKYFDNKESKIHKNLVKIEAFNELADYCYSKLKEGDFLFLEGKVLIKNNNIVVNACNLYY